MDSEIERLNEERIKLTKRVEDHETRITELEGSKWQMMNLMRELVEVQMDMLATNENKELYEFFTYTIPKEALFQATDEAIENGLLSEIEIGTTKNIRSLTSIRLTFNNGRKDFQSPRFGCNDDGGKVIQIPEKVTKVTAIGLRDCTCVLILNNDDSIAWGGSKSDAVRAGNQIDLTVEENQ